MNGAEIGGEGGEAEVPFDLGVALEMAEWLADQYNTAFSGEETAADREARIVEAKRKLLTDEQEYQRWARDPSWLAHQDRLRQEREAAVAAKAAQGLGGEVIGASTELGEPASPLTMPPPPDDRPRHRPPED